MTDDHQRLSLESCQATEHGRVVGVGPVAVEFLEIREDTLDIVRRERPLRMPGELGDLPGA